MKKVLIILIIIAYFNCYLGCSRTKHTTYSSAELATNNNRDIEVVTKESEKFRFKSNTYYTIGDTLVGQGYTMIDDEEQKLERINKGLKDIVYSDPYEEKLSTWGYVGMGAAVAGIIALVIIYGMDTNEVKNTAHLYESPRWFEK
jgi:hypothetical protein